MGQRQTTTHVFDADRVAVCRNRNYRNQPLPVQLNGIMDQSTWEEAMDLLEAGHKVKSWIIITIILIACIVFIPMLVDEHLRIYVYGAGGFLVLGTMMTQRKQKMKIERTLNGPRFFNGGLRWIKKNKSSGSYIVITISKMNHGRQHVNNPAQVIQNSAHHGIGIPVNQNLPIPQHQQQQQQQSQFNQYYPPVQQQQQHQEEQSRQPYGAIPSQNIYQNSRHEPLLDQREGAILPNAFAEGQPGERPFVGEGEEVSGDPSAPSVAPEQTPLPIGWRELIDPNSGRVYYLNDLSQTSQWERPSFYS